MATDTLEDGIPHNTTLGTTHEVKENTNSDGSP